MNQTDIGRSLRRWAERSGCDLCVLFGSRAGGGPRVAGDLDVAARFPSMPSPDRRLRLIAELQSAAGPERADLVFLHEDTDPVLRFEIFRTGELVFERESGTLVRERVRALMLYEDALPFRRARREKVRTIAARETGVP